MYSDSTLSESIYMLILILFLVIGSMLAYVSKSNLMPVSVHLGQYVLSDVPLFYVIICSLVLGLVLSYVIYVIHDIATSWTLRGKVNEIKKGKDVALELTKRVHQLELENEKLKHNSTSEPEDRNAL